MIWLNESIRMYIPFVLSIFKLKRVIGCMVDDLLFNFNMDHFCIFAKVSVGLD